MALLESARPGRRARWSYLAADPLEVLESAGDGPDPFAGRSPAPRADGRGAAASPFAMPFAGGLMGFLGYDLGRRLERLPALAAVDQWLPELRLGLYDQVVAVDHGSGQVWLASRAVDGDRERLMTRRDDVLARLHVAPTDAQTRVRRAAGRLRQQPRPGRLHGDGRGGPTRDRPRRALPGQRGAPARGALRRGSVARLSTPADRRPGGLRGVPRRRPRSRVRPCRGRCCPRRPNRSSRSRRQGSS